MRRKTARHTWLICFSGQVHSVTETTEMGVQTLGWRVTDVEKIRGPGTFDRLWLLLFDDYDVCGGLCGLVGHVCR